MRFKKIGSAYIIRLEKGELIITSLLGLCNKEKICAGYFNGIGACSEAELAHFNLKTKEYSTKKFTGQYEITSLHGNISTLDNKSYAHAHITIAEDKFAVAGGHLKEAVISATCEIVLVALNSQIERKKDSDTGLNLINI